jgi:hypothetical protein
MSLNMYGDAEVQHLADVITDARLEGILAGPWTLARYILDAGYRRYPTSPPPPAVVALLEAVDADPYPFLVLMPDMPAAPPPATCDDCGRTVRAALHPAWDPTGELTGRVVMVGPRCWRKRWAALQQQAGVVELPLDEVGPLLGVCHICPPDANKVPEELLLNHIVTVHADAFNNPVLDDAGRVAAVDMTRPPTDEEGVSP